MSFSDLLHNKKDIIRIVLDEYKLYLDESLPSAMIRGEVIVNFPKEIFIQGPITLQFEGIQRFLPWPEIMNYRALGDPIETKFQVIELSLLPPNLNGLMPAGIQRFPFEFPVPTYLPATTLIKDRIEIFYQISATLRRSGQNISDQHSIEGGHWFNRVRTATMKKKFVAFESIRIVRSMESVMARNFVQSTTSSRSVDMDTPSAISPPVTESILGSELNITQNESLTDPLPWNRRNLDYYQGSLDEQHDNLAFSLAGRSSDNFSSPISTLESIQGIRYKMGIDRTAVVLGTSVGIELMIAPTLADVKIRSIMLKISEKRKYSMKIPANYNWDIKSPTTRHSSEKIAMALKWACGYQFKDKNTNRSEPISTANLNFTSSDRSSRYVHRFCDDLNSVDSGSFKSNIAKEKDYFKGDATVNKNSGSSGSISFDYEQRMSFDEDLGAPKKMINLKELNQEVKLGEYFGGRFVLPVPECDNLLNPSMVHDSLKITHWSAIVVTLECNNKVFDIELESPMHVLNCRLVATGDECQTVLPPPPSYDPSKENICEGTNSSGSILEQREKITSGVAWGYCIPCPCAYKKLLKEKKIKKIADRNSTSQSLTTPPYPSTLSPEWGPPPMYSKN